MPHAPLTYAPFHQLDGRPHVIVDGPETTGTMLCLSHWPGSPALPDPLPADLSAQSAFRYLEHPDALHGDATLVSNNHFDQDGLAGLFALTDPDAAIPRRALVEDLAAAGDFGTYRYRAAARASMVISAFADPETSPFALSSDYAEATALLCTETLPLLVDLLEDPSGRRALWADEDAQLTASEQALATGEVVIDERPEVDLAVVTVHGHHDWSGHRFGGRRFAGVHPMAVHNATERAVVLLLMPDGHAQLNHRYETWVTYRSRRIAPRVDLVPLADALSALDDAVWSADPVDDLQPTMTPADGSSLAPDRIVAEVVRHLAEAPPAFDAFRGGLLGTRVT